MGEKIDLDRLDKILSRYKNKKGVLVSVLQEVQEEFGWVPPETVEHIASALKVFPSEVYGVLTFYSLFHLRPRGKDVITVCTGTACHIKGSERFLKGLRKRFDLPEGKETTADRKFTIEEVACEGTCSMAPVVLVNERVCGKISEDELLSEIDKIERESGTK